VETGPESVQEFRRVAEQVIDRIAAFLQEPERWRVLPAIKPGEVRGALATSPPRQPESFDDILADFDRIIMPGTTHWNHPGFMAYFATSGSAPGILAESLIAALNVNAMVWRSGPAQTELEEVTLDWLRQMIGLPSHFDGTINDTASSSTLYALAAAREFHTDLKLREEGLAGRPEVPRMRVYCSREAHSSVDKAVITLGLGLSGVRHIPTDANMAMDVDALRAAIAEDRADGVRPIAVVATIGTTSTTAIDPVGDVAEVCAQENVWLHVDAAYAGTVAMLPEMRWIMAGTERAHSLVVNPHKWMFVPMDCSVLYTQRPDLMRAAFSLVPDYLTTAESGVARNLMDYGVALGRRFRALKLWFVLRAYGTDAIAEVLRRHIRLAGELESWIRADSEFEVLAPRNFSVVVFRFRPRDADEMELERINSALIDAVNASGEVFLSHTKVEGRYAIRVALGNIRTAETHVRRAWALLRKEAANLVEV
jgi:aromatic-L-amino-acid/L-tryptophan decarboxylase